MRRIRSYFSDMWSVHLDAGTWFPVSQGAFRLSFLTKLDRPLSQEPRYLFVTHRVQVACVTPPCTPTHSQVFIAGLREELEASLSQPSQDPQLPKDCSFKGQLAVYLTSTLRLGIIFLISFFLWHKFLGKLFIIIVD